MFTNGFIHFYWSRLNLQETRATTIRNIQKAVTNMSSEKSPLIFYSLTWLITGCILDAVLFLHTRLAHNLCTLVGLGRSLPVVCTRCWRRIIVDIWQPNVRATYCFVEPAWFHAFSSKAWHNSIDRY